MENITLWRRRKEDGSVLDVQSSPPHTLVGTYWSERRVGPRLKPTVQNGRRYSIEGSGSNERRR
eukprot:15142628-Heterocapsa_arctica.AAC.1